MKNLISILILLLFWCSIEGVFASGIRSGSISYQCVDADSFNIDLHLKIDCDEASMPDSIIILVENSCQTSCYLNLSKTSVIIPYCSRSKCSGGDLPGYADYTYSAIIEMSSLCDNWSLSFTGCCRDSMVNVVGAPPYYIETHANFSVKTCNTSPVVYSEHTGCLNEVNSIMIHAVEPDGDSIVYQLIEPKWRKDSNLVYHPGFSFSNPIPVFQLDANTGMITFNSSELGLFAIAIEVSEFDRVTGVRLSSTLHEITLEILDCQLFSGQLSTIGMFNVQGTATQISPDTLLIGRQEQFSFDVQFYDSDTNDFITLFSNSPTWVGASVVIQNGNPATMSVDWISPNIDGIFELSVTAANDRCIVGLLAEKFVLIVGDGVNSIPLLKSLNIQFSPNPVVNVLSLDLGAHSWMDLSIYDMSGVRCINERIKNSVSSVNLEHLPPGVYFVQLVHGKQRQWSKIVKGP